jgi:hypothetical protein
MMSAACSETLTVVTTSTAMEATAAPTHMVDMDMMRRRRKRKAILPACWLLQASEV